MKRRVFFLMLIALTAMNVMAQPQRRRAEAKENEKKSSSAVTMSERAKSQYRVSTAIPDEVVWKRDVYRTLDLTNDCNAVLYYPVEPLNGQMNLFTLVFRLLLNEEIPAYEYRLDGTEVMTTENRVKMTDVLDRFHVLYEEKEGKLLVEDSDIPSSEVLSYYIKESSYYDHRTATYQTRVTAFCPVIHRDDGFSEQATKYPMFWVNYDEVSAYLERMGVMTSSYNNASNMSINDFFITRRYKGDIYKTNNLRNQTLAQYCPTDSAMTKEQERIEQQLVSFEKSIWTSPTVEEPEDTTKVSVEAKEDKKSRRQARRANEDKVEKKEKVSSSKSSSMSAPRISVRRQRR